MVLADRLYNHNVLDFDRMWDPYRGTTYSAGAGSLAGCARCALVPAIVTAFEEIEEIPSPWQPYRSNASKLVTRKVGLPQVVYAMMSERPIQFQSSKAKQWIGVAPCGRWFAMPAKMQKVLP